jgi:hypothetical protein
MHAYAALPDFLSGPACCLCAAHPPTLSKLHPHQFTPSHGPTPPLLQARLALQLVTAALVDLVAPHSCLSLFNVAAACGAAPLAQRAWSLALRCFPQALHADAAGLAAMQEESLLRLLRSDGLQVCSGWAGSKG